MAQTKSQRVAYGQTLLELAKDNKNIVVLEADLGKSTMGLMVEPEHPEQFFEMGIAEANMAGVAAGLSLTGRVPFMASFAVFSTGRCYDQIRTGICIPDLNVKICGSSSGLSDYGDGSTHQSIEDLAIMSVLPNMEVFSPVDAIETAKVVRYMASAKGPMYLRVNRNELPLISNPDEEFVPGKVYTIKEGKDAVVFATGVMVSKALEAAEQLEKEGISLKVVNVPSIKPIDAEGVCAICEDFEAIVTAEEHSVIGGLGATIARAINSKLARKIQQVGIQDVFGTSGQNYDVLLEAYGLTSGAICEAVKKAMK